jgi:hypothetical protein
VAIVDRVIGATIFVVEQNASNTGRETYSLSNSRITGGYGPVRGTVHSPKNPSRFLTRGTVTVARNKDGRLEMFAVGTANDLYRRHQNTPGGTWSAWTKMDGGVTNVAAETNADGRIELFAVGNANDLYHRWQTSPGGSWSPWARLDGVIHL